MSTPAVLNVADLSTAIDFKFRLFVAGDTQNSEQARANLTAICKRHLAGRFEIEIVDVVTEPLRALEDRVFLTPMLIRLEPQPVRRIVGTLSNKKPLFDLLGLEVAAQ